MKESSVYQPVDHDDSKSSSEMEDDMLINKHRFTRSQRRQYMRPVIALIVVLALAVYTSIVVSVTWGMTKESRRHGTRFLKCKRLILTKGILRRLTELVLLLQLLQTTTSPTSLMSWSNGNTQERSYTSGSPARKSTAIGTISLSVCITPPYNSTKLRGISNEQTKTLDSQQSSCTRWVEKKKASDSQTEPTSAHSWFSTIFIALCVHLITLATQLQLCRSN
jgi:hypothetical protein